MLIVDTHINSSFSIPRTWTFISVPTNFTGKKIDRQLTRITKEEEQTLISLLYNKTLKQVKAVVDE